MAHPVKSKALSVLQITAIVAPYVVLAALCLTFSSRCPPSGRQAPPGAAEQANPVARLLSGGEEALPLGGNFTAKPAQELAPLWQEGMLNPLQLWLAGYQTGPTWEGRDTMLDVFHRHLHRFRGKPVTVVEIGPRGGGGSLAMWRDYLGPHATVLGVVADEKYLRLEHLLPGVAIVVGDRGDREFLRRVAQRSGRIDVLLDSGGGGGGAAHAHQVAAFEELFPRLAPDGGVFICDGLHTSYWPESGGGWRRASTYVEYLKGLIDKLNGYHVLHYKILFGKSLDSAPAGRPPSDVAAFARSTNNMHFYDGAVVIEKRVREGLPTDSM